MLLEPDFVIFFIVDALELKRIVQSDTRLDTDDLVAYAGLVDRTQLFKVHPRAGHAVVVVHVAPVGQLACQAGDAVCESAGEAGHGLAHSSFE